MVKNINIDYQIAIAFSDDIKGEWIYSDPIYGNTGSPTGEMIIKTWDSESDYQKDMGKLYGGDIKLEMKRYYQNLLPMYDISKTIKFEPVDYSHMEDYSIQFECIDEDGNDVSGIGDGYYVKFSSDALTYIEGANDKLNSAVIPKFQEYEIDTLYDVVYESVHGRYFDDTENILANDSDMLNDNGWNLKAIIGISNYDDDESLFDSIPAIGNYPKIILKNNTDFPFDPNCNYCVLSFNTRDDIDDGGQFGTGKYTKMENIEIGEDGSMIINNGDFELGYDEETIFIFERG